MGSLGTSNPSSGRSCVAERNDHWMMSQDDSNFSSNLFLINSVLSHLNSVGLSLLICKMKGLS